MSRASALPAAETRRAAALFRALADETRLHLVARMAAAGPEPIVKLSAASSVSRQAITKHLRVLARAGLARAQRAGRERIWRLDLERLAEAHDWLERISRQWDDALARLQELVGR